MADRTTKTTSSKSLDENEPQPGKASPVHLPESGEAQLSTKLATDLTESYQLVKQRQQKYNELSSKIHESSVKPPEHAEWQEVCTNKNKLKRKKKLSSSLTSVSDSVNQEKRTRIEGIQLNCRGKLNMHEAAAPASAPPTPTHSCGVAVQRTEKLAAKPPLPPVGRREERSANASSNEAQAANATQATKVPPPRLKRKLQENMQTIQKLNALAEQLRLEINELKSSLTTERGAVRVLRAQNESETRKWKNEVKKLQHAADLLKKNAPTNAVKKPQDALAGNAENLPAAAVPMGVSSLANHEIQRLTNEIIALKEANKALEEKRAINCDADRRKAADIRELRDSYEIRLTQLTKSAKTEISRLLEEIKTKERNIGQLKKELQQPSRVLETTKSRNATNTNSTTNKTTNKTFKTQQKQPEKKQKFNKSNKTTNETQESKQDTTKDTAGRVQNPNEMIPLKDLELINNTRNLQQNNNINSNNNHNNNSNNNGNNSLIHRTTKIFNTAHNSKLKIQEPAELQQCNNNNKNMMLTETQTNLKCLLNNNHNNNHNNNNNSTAVSSSETTATKPCDSAKEHHSLPHDLLTERFIGVHNDAHDYRGKDNNSDSDSALSSAPPSISPQPPPNGMESADIWQTLRNYSTDIEKLQKDLELLQKENADLRQELHLAKEQIMESEKSARAAANNTKLQQLMERIKYLEEQERQLEAESNELREQNELLEFRILELEDNNDKWSLQSHATPSSTSTTTTPSSMATTKDVWSCCKPNKDDPMTLLFGSSNSSNNNSTMDPQMDSGIISPHTHQHLEERLNAMSPCDLNLMDHMSNDEMRRRLTNMLKRLSANEDDKQCLQQILSLLQNLDAISHQSGPDSLTTSSCDEPSSLDLVKSRISDYSSASSSTSSASSARQSSASTDNHSKSKSSASIAPTTVTTNSRIVATVLPYNSSAAYQHHVPTNTPTESPRKTRPAWQSNSLSESGVFVESDFLSDAGENNVCTQTDFEEATLAASAKEFSHELLKLQQSNSVTAAYLTSSPRKQLSTEYCEPKRLQYYKERLALLESKVLIYESSGDLQAKRLADRLQREIQLEQQVKDLRDRVDFLETENATLEEEKCEFEEAENDTRLRLQRLEVELEILSQRNIELEMSREALSAKYKDCRSECLILRDDLSVSETQIRHLEEDKQKVKENLEFLHSTLPLFMLYHTILAAGEQQNQHSQVVKSVAGLETTPKAMGNALFPINQTSTTNSTSPTSQCERSASLAQFERDESVYSSNQNLDSCACQQRELHYLKEEVKCLRHQIKELNSRHYEAMESADSHWVDLEKEYKDREESFRAKETCLKQKINRLQDCVRDDARAANEKILAMEEAEKELKCCLMRLSKEHREMVEEHQNVMEDNERLKEQHEQLKDQQQPLRDSLEMEKKHNKSLTDELNFMRKLQQESESRNLQEMEALRSQMFELKKEFLHIEVTNSELKEEVATLEQQLEALQNNEKECVDKIRCLTDEVRSKEEMCAKLEKRLERSEGYSLAQELNGSPSKRFKREDVKDLQSASKGLGTALRSMKDCERTIPSHQKFQSVARDVKKLADTLLGGQAPVDDEAMQNSTPKLILTEITRI